MGANELCTYWGGFSSDGDEFLLQQVAADSPFVQVTYSPASVTDTDQQRVGLLADLRQQVSILGRPGALVMTQMGKLQSVVAEKIVSHDDVRRLADDMFYSGRFGSAFDNWLLAERRLLTGSGV